MARIDATGWSVFFIWVGVALGGECSLGPFAALGICDPGLDVDSQAPAKVIRECA